MSNILWEKLARGRWSPELFQDFSVPSKRYLRILCSYGSVVIGNSIIQNISQYAVTI